jgi:hypothetical protein
MYPVIYRKKFGIKIKRFSNNSHIVRKIKNNFELQKPYSEYIFGLNSKLTNEHLRVKKFKAIFEKIIFFDKLLLTKFKRNEWNFITLRYLFNGKTSLNEYETIVKSTAKTVKKMFMFNRESNIYRTLDITRRKGRPERKKFNIMYAQQFSKQLKNKRIKDYEK